MRSGCGSCVGGEDFGVEGGDITFEGDFGYSFNFGGDIDCDGCDAFGEILGALVLLRRD